MKLFLIRHAESEHNVAQAYAGVTDSALTNHGVLQISRLARHLSSHGIVFTKVFASDLQRARMTAEGICITVAPALLPLLREKDFGSLEAVSWSSRALSTVDQNPDHRPQESQASITARAMGFLNDYLLPVLFDSLASGTGTHEVVAVVSHGILLGTLFRCLSSLFEAQAIKYGSAATGPHVPAWSNTGYLELNIQPQPQPAPIPVASAVAAPVARPLPDTAGDTVAHPTATSTNSSVPFAGIMVPGPKPLLAGWTMTVLTINGRDHLRDLRRTGGGVGSAKYDERQKSIDNFFKAR